MLILGLEFGDEFRIFAFELVDCLCRRSHLIRRIANKENGEQENKSDNRRKNYSPRKFSQRIPDVLLRLFPRVIFDRSSDNRDGPVPHDQVADHERENAPTAPGRLRHENRGGGYDCSRQYRRQARFNAAKAAPVASTTASAPARCNAPCAISSSALGPPVADRRTDYLIWSLRSRHQFVAACFSNQDGRSGGILLDLLP